MKSLTAIVAFTVGLTGSVFAADPAPPAPPAGTASPHGVGPRIRFETTVYDWGKTPYAEPVKIEFVFTNTGDSMLEVSNVAPGCHCTMAGDWTHQVEPGKTGKIPIQFDGLTAGPVMRGITVTCNDTSQPPVSLLIKGTIWKRIEFPDLVSLTVAPSATTNTTMEVSIVNNMEELITLSAPKIESIMPAPRGDKPVVAAEIKTIKPGKEFNLIVTALPGLAVDTVATMTIKTSSTNVPVINTRVFVHIPPPPPDPATPPVPPSPPVGG